MLVLDETKRPTFEDISKDSYFADHRILVNETGINPKAILPYSSSIVHALSVFPKHIIDDIENVRHHVLPMVYFLILKKALELNGESKYLVFSSHFDASTYSEEILDIVLTEFRTRLTFRTPIKKI